jgi:nitrate reductase delta subunit
VSRNEHAVLYAAAARLLEYPDARWRDGLPLVRAALAEQRGPLPRLLESAAARIADDGAEAACRCYVETFDLSRRHALYLSYWTDGDTRRRGEVLGAFKRHYRDSGWLVDLDGELPDYLPLVLEFTARADYRAGRGILSEYRASLELLRIGLADAGSPYAPVLEAVCRSLPGASPTSRAEAMALAGPPREAVGLDPFDPRLLPMAREARTTPEGAR